MSALSPAAVEAGKERMRVDFGLETNRGRRFALWALMHMLRVAPDLDVAFADEAERDTARDFMELSEPGAGESAGSKRGLRVDSLSGSMAIPTRLLVSAALRVTRITHILMA